MPKLTREQIVAAIKNRPGKKVKPEKDEEKRAMDEAGAGLSAVSKDWANRWKAMDDSEFWFCFVWRNDEDLESFAATYAMPSRDGRFVDGRDLLHAVGIDPDGEDAPPPVRRIKPKKKTREQVLYALNYECHPLPENPPAEGEFHEVADAEMPALLAIQQDSDWLATYGEVIDYPHWLCLWFVSREDKFKALNQMGLLDIGDKYLDGYEVAESLKTSFRS